MVVVFETFRTYTYDRVTLYDGFDNRAPVLATLSGSDVASYSMFVSTQRYMYITFRSFKPTYQTSSNVVDGFIATYKSSKFSH